MTTIIPTLRQEIEQRLGELQAESDKLRNALGALKDNGAGKPVPGTFSEAGISISKKPKPAAAKAEKTERKPRASVQAVILAELERIAPERASAKPLAEKLDLNRNVVSTTLSKLAKDNRVDPPTDTDKGYRARIDAPQAA